MRAGLAAAIAVMAAVALAAHGGAADAQVAVTYTATSVDRSTTDLEFTGLLRSASGTLSVGGTVDASEWKVYDIKRFGSAAPATLNTERMVSSATVRELGATPVIRLSHAAINENPYPIVQYVPAATPGLSGSASAAVSTDAVVASPSIPAFTAEVRDGAQVHLTFETAGIMERPSHPILCGDGVTTPIADKYLVFFHAKSTNTKARDYDCAGKNDRTIRYPSGWTNNVAGQATLSFAGEGARDLLTSSPVIVFGHRGSAYYHTAAGDMVNGTAVVATDNASPVAFASFEDADTIMVEFSEEMSAPSASALGGVTVTGPGGAVPVSGTPVFTAHTPPTATAAFGRPTLEITLSQFASPGMHTVAFPAALQAAGGPADKRTVGDAAVPFADSYPPTFAAEVRDGGMIQLTFSEAVRRESSRAINDGTIYVHTYDTATPVAPGASRAAALAVDPSTVTFTESTSTMTLAFTGEARERLLTSTPRVGYAHADGAPVLEDAQDNAMAPAVVTATDNASPVAYARFTDARTIGVTFSEEMATPNDATLDGVSVSAGGQAVQIMGRPAFMAHTAATATSAIALPTLEITLASSAPLDTEHTVSFGSMRAMGGPMSKRTVADAAATLTDATPPTFVVHKVSNTRLVVTFSEEVQRVPGTTPSLDDWEIDATPGTIGDALVNPTAVTLGHNYADLTIAAVGNSILPAVRYAESTSTIEDLAGNALPLPALGALSSASATPIPLSASHTRANDGSSQVAVTFSASVAGTTTAADWEVEGASTVTVAFTSPSSTVTLSGFMLMPDATPDVDYTGTGLTADGGAAAVPSRSVRAADAIVPTITAARTVSDTRIEMTLSEPVAFATGGTEGGAAAATGHWRTALTEEGTTTETSVGSVEVSGRTVAVSVAGADAWSSVETPDVRYTRTVTDGAAGEIVDASGNALADVAFTMTADGAGFVASAAVTSDALLDIGDQRDPADNTHTEYVTVRLSEPASFTIGTMAQRAAHWTVRDDEATPPANVAVSTAALVGDSARHVRLTLAAPLSSTAATPLVSYSSAMSAGRLVSVDDSAPLPSFTGLEARDGIGPRLVMYPESVRILDSMGDETAVKSRERNTMLTDNRDDSGSQLELKGVTGQKYLRFTFSEPIDPASVGDSGEFANISMRIQLASGELLRGLSGRYPVVLNNGATSTTWLPATYSALRTEDSGGALTIEAAGKHLHGLGADNMDDTADDPVTPPATPYLGTGGNVVTYHQGADAPSLAIPVQDIFGFAVNAAPTDLEGNAYRTNRHDDSLHGAPADVHDPAAYAADTRGIHGTFIVSHDTTAPLFRATATAEDTVQVVYMEPVEIDGAAPALAASHWRLDLTPNDNTDNTDGTNWVTPTGLTTAFSAFEHPGHYAFGAPGHLVPTDSRLAVTLTGFSGLDPTLKSASPDTRPTLHYVGESPMGFVPAVVDKYGNRAEKGATARLVDTLPPTPTVAFTDESTVLATFSEQVTYGEVGLGDFALYDAAGAEVAESQMLALGSATMGDVLTLNLSSPAADGAHEFRITSSDGWTLTDDVGASVYRTEMNVRMLVTGVPSPRAWVDRHEAGTLSETSLPDNVLPLPATFAVPALPPAPTLTAETSSLNTVAVTFQVGGTDASLVRKATGTLDTANWAVELVPAGETRTERTAATADDIAVTGVATVPATGTSFTGVTITLDSASANIGDTSKRVYVTYTESQESEFQTAQATGTIQRSLLEGTGALAADGVPPGITGELSALRKITLTFDEAPAADPTMGVSYAVTVADDSVTPADSDTDPDAIALSTTTTPVYTAATASEPATVVLTTAANLDATHGTHTVTITASGESSRIADANMAALPLSHTVDIPAPAAPMFTAETTSNTEILVTFDQPVSLNSMSTTLDKANWIVDPDGSDGSTDMAADNIAVSSVSFSDADDTITLTLDGTSSNIGDTSKAPYVEYTGSMEIVNVFASALASGTSATATEGVPPSATAAFTAEQTVTLTFSEALAADPSGAMAGNTFGVYAAGGDTDLASATGLVYTAAAPSATPPTPATLAIQLSSIPGTVAHEVRIGGIGAIEDAAGNALDKSAAVTVAAPPAPPTFTAETASVDTVTLTPSVNLARIGSSPPALAASSWAVELVPDGTTPTARTPGTDDDIEVTGVMPDDENDISSITLTLDGTSANIGDTSKTVFVTYVAAESELISNPAVGSGMIPRSMIAGTAAHASDGAPPKPVGEVTGAREITLTFREAITMSPNREGYHYSVYASTDTSQNMNRTADGSADDANILAYTAATQNAPARMTIAMNTDVGGVAHYVRIHEDAINPASIEDSLGNVLVVPGASMSPHLNIQVPAPPAPTFTASVTSWTEIVLTFDTDIRLTSGTTALTDAVWLVDPDGMEPCETGNHILTTGISAIAGRTLTLTLNSTDANIGDTSKTPCVAYTASTPEIESALGAPLAMGTSAIATDDALPGIAAAMTGSTGSPGTDPADPADNVYADRIDVTVSEPIIIESGATAAQRAAHWTVSNDHDGDMGTPAVNIEVTDATIVLADAADTASRTVRLALAGDAALAGTTATPSVSYNAESSTMGRLILPGELASSTTLVASAMDVVAEDGIGPRLVALPVRGDLTPDTANDDDREALVFTFSEDIDPATVRPAGERAAMIVARSQIETGSPTGRFPPLRHDDGACATGTRWLPATYGFAEVAGAADLRDIVAGTVTNDMGAMVPGMVAGTQANTIRLDIASFASGGTQGVLWACFTVPSTSLEGWTRDSAIRDTAGNPYVPVEPTPHSQFLTSSSTRAPEFTATVTGATTVSVFYDEPVRLAAGASIDAAEWTIDTTPNDGDATNAVAATSVSHSFGPMLRQEYWLYGEPDHTTPTDARLRIDLTFDGLTLDPNQAAPAAGAMDERPRVTYTSSVTGKVDVEDVYGNAASSPASVQARDTIPPEVESIAVGVSTASTSSAPVPSAQHARASASSPVDITFSVTFNEAPKSGTPPILGVLPASALTATTTLPAAGSSQDTQRIWAMAETAATDDGHSWEYTWTVVNMLPGETTARDWGSGFELSYGIVVQDAEGNAIAYSQSSGYPAGSTSTVTLDSRPPVVIAQSMASRVGDSAPYTYATTGKDGSTIELRFTVDERSSRLVTPVTGAGGAVTYTEGLSPSAVRFFSGADEVAATSLTGAGTTGDPYRATATIPDGHAEGTDAIEWSISVLDIYGQEGTMDHNDIGTSGHVASLGFRVDNTAPMIVDAMSSVGADRSGGSRMASDALEPRVRGGEALLVDITFDEPVLVRSGGEPPKVRGYGEVLEFAEDGTAMYVEREFHAMMPMTPVAGTGDATAGYTRWQHSYTVPDAATLEIHDATYVADILMPMDAAGNTMTFTGERGGQDVRIDNVAPSMGDLEAFVRGANTANNEGLWAIISYTEHGGLLTDGLRAYLGGTLTEARLAGAGTLMIFTEDEPGQTIACVDPSRSTVSDSCAPAFELTFDYGAGTASETALTDMAGNAVVWNQEDQGPNMDGSMLAAGGYRTEGRPALFAGLDAPIMVTGLPHSDSVDLAAVGLAGTGDLDFDVTYESPTVPGLSIRLAAGTKAQGLADPPEITLTNRIAVHGLPGEDYYTALLQDALVADDRPREEVMALRSLSAMGARATVESGRADAELLLSEPARITIPGAANALHAYWVSMAFTATQGDDRVNAIPECGRGSSADAVDPTDVPSRTGADPTMYTNAANAECFVREPSTGSLHVWTNHFTQFGASTESIRTGGSGCDDCTPPTLGVDSTGVRRVAGGFTYNGATHNVDYYYTPMPLIEVETGVENVAVLKIFEDSGASRLAHAGLAFGLGRGQHFAESEAEIRVSISHMGELSIALDDPSGAIDAETLRASSELVECMPGSSAECVAVTIHHTFREPLDFDVVSTNVWDTRRNAWQNFYNHGVHVSGESLNPSRGIEVNGGELVLYPLISARVDDNGDGIYDYDERHVTYMLDDAYGVWRLTPDGTYAPLRNLYSLHHEVDDAMYADGRIRTHGAERSSALFAEELARQAEIAEGIMAEMGIGVPEKEAPAPEPSPYEGMATEPRLERLSEAIAAEINVAERLMGKISPALAKR